MTLPLNKRIVLEWGGVPFLGHSFPFRCLFSPAGCRASVDAEGNGPSPVWLGEGIGEESGGFLFLWPASVRPEVFREV